MDVQSPRTRDERSLPVRMRACSRYLFSEGDDRDIGRACTMTLC
jgi:hypothetical protein